MEWILETVKNYTRHVWLKSQKEMVNIQLQTIDINRYYLFWCQSKPQKPDQKINLYFYEPLHARKGHVNQLEYLIILAP